MQGSIYDLNQADKYREFGATIPDGEFVWLRPVIKNGNNSLPGFSPEDNGIFTASKPPSDFVYAAIEFTVTRGPHSGSKVFENWGFSGGKADDKGQFQTLNITKRNLRGLVESAYGINPDDNSAQAGMARNIRSIKSIEQLEFIARIGVEEGGRNDSGGQYPDRNTISKIVLVTDPEYAPMRQGQQVPAKPQGKRPSRGGATGGTAAAATGGGQPALWQVEAAAAGAPAQQPPQPQPQPQYQPPPQQPQPQPQPQYQPQPAPQQQPTQYQPAPQQQPTQYQPNPPPTQFQQSPPYSPVPATPPAPPGQGWVPPNGAAPPPQQGWAQQPPQQQPPQQQQQPQQNGGWAQQPPQPDPASVWTAPAPLNPGGNPAGNQAPDWLQNQPQ